MGEVKRRCLGCRDPINPTKGTYCPECREEPGTGLRPTAEVGEYIQWAMSRIYSLEAKLSDLVDRMNELPCVCATHAGFCPTCSDWPGKASEWDRDHPGGEEE